ncbi:hypothetical protein DV096_12365 [Bradymonadaceae bacterium TMQ3]|nr:hypothetical protein DV096_12365 [Bradymonadaceae bacterium TMQ3]TXC75324.1 hypothetical protein FRC91_11415 [Bradymonadales bacterium TMQ1]
MSRRQSSGWRVRVGLYVLSVGLAAGCLPTPGQKGVGADDDAGAGDVSADVDITPTPVEDGWVYQPLENTFCGGGGPAGLGLNLNEASTDLVIFLNGGGACWDAASCYVLNAAVNIEGEYTAAKFASEVRPLIASGLFDREDEANPWPDASYAFVPYCTADLHSGDAIKNHDAFQPERMVHHKGAVNMARYLAYLSEELPRIERVWMLGASAGGYGATLNFWRVEEAFPGAEAHLLADSAPFVQPGEGRWGIWQNVWEMTLPPECEGCEARADAIPAAVGAAHPDSRIGLLAFEDDAVIAVFFAIGLFDMGARTRALVNDAYQGEAMRGFSVASNEHVMLTSWKNRRDKNGEALPEFLRWWVEGR